MGHYVIQFNVKPWDGPKSTFGGQKIRYVWPICFRSRTKANEHIDKVKVFQNANPCLIPGKTKIVSCSVERIDSKLFPSKGI